MEYVTVVRSKGDWQKGKVKISDIEELRWDEISGGVRKRTGTCDLYGYIMCDQIVEGVIGHSGIHGPCPHRIKVLIQKCDNSEEIYERLVKRAGGYEGKYKVTETRIGAVDTIRELVRNNPGILATDVASSLEDEFTKTQVQKSIRYLKQAKVKTKDGLYSEKCGRTQKLYIRKPE